jgi:hypothetical protein
VEKNGFFSLPPVTKKKSLLTLLLEMQLLNRYTPSSSTPAGVGAIKLLRLYYGAEGA